jgi:hypothetical protein
MTKLLAQAIALLRLSPPDAQDSAARVLISQLEEEPEPGDLEAIKEGREDFARGDFVTLDEWRHEVGLIPSLTDQNPCAHWRKPMDMMRQGCSTSLFHASQQ